MEWNDLCFFPLQYIISKTSITQQDASAQHIGLWRVPWICASEGRCLGHVRESGALRQWRWSWITRLWSWTGCGLTRIPREPGRTGQAACIGLQPPGHWNAWAMETGRQGLQPPCLLTPQDCACGPHTLDLQEAPERGGSFPRPNNTSSSTQVTCDSWREAMQVETHKRMPQHHLLEIEESALITDLYKC